MNDEKREAMIEAAATHWAEWGQRWSNGDANLDMEEILADFALEQMRPLEDRIAELERRLAVAVEALERIGCVEFSMLDATAFDSPVDVKDAREALAQIRGGAAAGKPDEAEVRGCITKND